MNSQKYLNLIKENKSNLCIGLDLRVSRDHKLDTAMEIIEETSDYASAYKPNRQFWLDVNHSEIKQLNKKIENVGCFSIIDHKLSDIGSSNTVALLTSKQEGFDLITVSPFPGNLRSTSREAEKIGIDIISLVVMSNKEASWMIKTNMYEEWAKEANSWAAGMVIGTTNHISGNIIERIAKESPKPFVLAPGLGHQGGRITEIVKNFGEKSLFNVSRGISMSQNYKKAAKKFHQKINQLIE